MDLRYTVRCNLDVKGVINKNGKQDLSLEVCMPQYAPLRHILTIASSSFREGPQIVVQQYTQCVTDVVISANPMMAKTE